MATSTDLISNVYDLLAKTLSASGASGSYLQLSWPGIALSPADFKPYDNPQGNYDPQVAEETFSFLSNLAPVCSAVRFDDSGFEIDDLYQILLFSAIPQGADPDSLAVNPMYRLFADAQYDFVRTRKGSLRDPEVLYSPCRATPSDWYTEASAKFWPTISLSSTEVKPADKNSPFMKMGGEKLLTKGVWQIPPRNVDSAGIEKQLRTTINSKLTTFSAKLKLPGGITKPPLAGVPVAMGAAKLPPTRVTPLSMEDQAFAARFREFNATRAAKSGLHPTLVTSKLSKLPQIAIDPKRFEPVTTKLMTLDKVMAIRHLLANMLTSTPAASTTEGFSISFKFCRVNIDRGAWFKNALMNTKNWYMFNTKAGEYALGVMENNLGMFPMLPDSFIAIRDLKITANWSQQDQATAGQAKSFGPFEIQSGSFNQNTLEAKGLQIIAWTSRLNPCWPPIKDPAMP